MKLQAGARVQNYRVALSCISTAAELATLSGIQENTMPNLEGYSTETLWELLVGAALLVTWVFVQVAFALYYAKEFYTGCAEYGNSGFEFPNNPSPTYWDFIRFAFVIGMRIQTPRAQVTSQKLRRTVILQCVILVTLNTSMFMVAVLVALRR